MFVSLTWLTALLAGIFSAHVTQRLCFPYFWKDLFYLTKVIRYGIRLEIYKMTSRVVTVIDRFVQQAERVPNKPFLIFEGISYSYRDIDERSNKVARVFEEQGTLKKGDTVALLMSNDPDFICVWFGLSKLGCSVAFLNTNIKSRSLLHCFNCCNAKILVVGADLLETLDDILPSLQKDNISVWALKKDCSYPGVHSLLDKMENTLSQPIPAQRRAATSLKTPTLYIFTSGTTGATLVLKKKFSASQFWNDCRKYNVTIFQYIGELCRYLCNQPEAKNEKDHKIHMGVGNGLRQDVWREFHRRFGEIRMCELYGSTEGNLCFMNHVGKIGAVGRSNFFYKLLFKYDLVRYDMARDEPVRTEQGFCVRVKKGETGLLLSRVNIMSPFFGYAGSKQLTEKKLLRDVFVKGDAYFNTGDLMAEDQDGFICFRDRVGDTFRWKGENVATTEVTEILGLVDFIQEANVYGVEILGSEGRAGMAAVTVRPEYSFDGKKLFEHVCRELPTYARPLFIRLQECMEMTSTFKQQKFRLVESGFNPATITDPIFFLDYTTKCYIPLTDSIYQSILNGQQKL
ncbi:long-chain fatty acid transport protein 6 isoform X2 [Chanos chanos]|uniref:long-chain-fatty-acid--CoA ligase n=1 Tax=Chanos chanos TaxID=29144 RepID=A0A6J2UVD5_CHACN|nr:long-chain fatty acid transport protein 6-like isoform X2 [Chanos chanos]